MNGCDIRQASVQTGTWSISSARQGHATASHFAPFVRSASSTTCLRRWRDSTPSRRARRRTASRHRDTRECYRPHDPSLFSVTMRWSRAEASAWDRHWCDRAGSDTFATADSPQSPPARHRSSWWMWRGICRAPFGTVLMAPFCGPDRRVSAMWTAG